MQECWEGPKSWDPEVWVPQVPFQQHVKMLWEHVIGQWRWTAGTLYTSVSYNLFCSSLHNNRIQVLFSLLFRWRQAFREVKWLAHLYLLENQETRVSVRCFWPSHGGLLCLEWQQKNAHTKQDLHGCWKTRSYVDTYMVSRLFSRELRFQILKYPHSS